MAFVKRLSQDMKRKFAKIIVMGESGVGKTSLAATLPNPSKSVVLNLKTYEDGDIPLSTVPGLPIWDIANMKDLNEALTELKKSPPEAIFVDSLTAISMMALAELKLDPEMINSKNKFAVYQELGDFLKETFLAFKEIPSHVIFTAHLKVPNNIPQGTEKYIPKVDGNLFSELVNGFTDAVIAMSSDDSGNRFLLTQPRSKYACKFRMPLGSVMPGDNGVLSGQDVSIDRLLKLMGFAAEVKITK